MKEVTIDRYEQLQSDTIKLVRFPLIVGCDATCGF